MARSLLSGLSIPLGAPPAGCHRESLDGDVVQLAIGTMLVADSIEGLAKR